MFRKRAQCWSSTYPLFPFLYVLQTDPGNETRVLQHGPQPRLSKCFEVAVMRSAQTHVPTGLPPTCPPVLQREPLENSHMCQERRGLGSHVSAGSDRQWEVPCSPLYFRAPRIKWALAPRPRADTKIDQGGMVTNRYGLEQACHIGRLRKWWLLFVTVVLFSLLFQTELRCGWVVLSEGGGDHVPLEHFWAVVARPAWAGESVCSLIQARPVVGQCVFTGTLYCLQ